jgi:opacity protein-like surface antigen
VGIVTWRSARVVGLALAVLAGAAGDARGQMFGIGARMVSVSGADSPAVDQSDPSNTRFVGGLVRLNASKHITLEVAMDYQSITNPTETARLRNTPIQVSGLLVPMRTRLTPYFLAGVGWYKHKLEALENGRGVLTAETTDFGYHTGVGGQLMFGRHVGISVDYRYTWVDREGVDGFMGVVRSAASLTSVVGMLTSLGSDRNSEESSITRSGSMWTGGLTVYF